MSVCEGEGVFLGRARERQIALLKRSALTAGRVEPRESSESADVGLTRTSAAREICSVRRDCSARSIMGLLYHVCCLSDAY